MEVVVTSRHCEVSDRFRSHVAEKLSRLEKHDHRIMRVNVEVEQERNPRQADRAVRVELTAFSRGPVIRAEAAASRQDGRPRPCRGQDGLTDATRRPTAGCAAGRVAARPPAASSRVVPDGIGDLDDDVESLERRVGPITVTGDGPLVVREKTHRAGPMTLDQALYEMELVGHDFYLFVDKESERPAVVYRRRGYDYGVISLELGSRD